MLCVTRACAVRISVKNQSRSPLGPNIYQVPGTSLCATFDWRTWFRAPASATSAPLCLLFSFAFLFCSFFFLRSILFVYLINLPMDPFRKKKIDKHGSCKIILHQKWPLICRPRLRFAYIYHIWTQDRYILGTNMFTDILLLQSDIGRSFSVSSCAIHPARLGGEPCKIVTLSLRTRAAGCFELPSTCVRWCVLTKNENKINKRVTRTGYEKQNMQQLHLSLIHI